MSVIDISHPLDETIPVYPGDPPLRLTKRETEGRDGTISYYLETGLHAGTHIDMPLHMLPEGRCAADFPVERFMGEGVLLDARAERIITMKDAYAEAVKPGSIVLLYTGFDRMYRKDVYFTEYPAVGGELAAFLLSKNIKMLGMDTPAPDFPPFSFHKMLLAGGTFVLENLTNLQSLLYVKSFEVIALPLKIQAEASPVRAVCRVCDSI